jgi:hypothetical protein
MYSILLGYINNANNGDFINLKKKDVGFQDGSEREEAEREPPIMKTWRDVGDTLCRQNHQEEAKL